MRENTGTTFGVTQDYIEFIECIEPFINYTVFHLSWNLMFHWTSDFAAQTDKKPWIGVHPGVITASVTDKKDLVKLQFI